MINELDNKLIETEGGNPYFNEESYEVFPLEKDRFCKINDKKINRKIIFVDGGNQELFGTSNFSIQLNRVYFNIFDGTKRIVQSKMPDTIEFFSLTVSNFKNENIYYDTLLFPIKDEWEEYLPLESHLSFNSTDRTIGLGDMRADIQRVGSIARRFTEWSYAYNIMESMMDENDILVTDGTLQTAFTNENNYLDKIHELAMKKNIVLSGLAKTSSLFTTTGLSLLGFLGMITEDWRIDHGRWFYKVAEGITSSHAAMIYIIKLHESSNHLFRFEISKKQAQKMNDSQITDVMSNLASNSNDISFPGYPYGLIDADDNARVKGNETDAYKIMILSEISSRGLWNTFHRYMHSSDAHDILNSLKGGKSVER